MSAEEFFAKLGDDVEPEKIEGLDHSYLFEVAGEGSWLVVVRDGAVSVSQGEGTADVTISTSSEVFDGLVAGTQNPMKAYLGGKIKVKGDMGAAMKLQRLF